VRGDGEKTSVLDKREFCRETSRGGIIREKVETGSRWPVQNECEASARRLEAHCPKRAALPLSASAQKNFLRFRGILRRVAFVLCRKLDCGDSLGQF